MNVGGPEKGPLAESYSTLFFFDEQEDDEQEDASGATITYTGGPIVGPIAFLLVKDGNQKPAWYLFNLSADQNQWNGIDTLYLSGFWPEKGAISHITLYGNRVSVPEPATMLLLGLGLVGLAGYGRRKFKDN